MPKIDITKTELVWPSKYNEDGTLNEVPGACGAELPSRGGRAQTSEELKEALADYGQVIGNRIGRLASNRKFQLSPAKRVIVVDQSLFDFYEGKEGETFEEGWKNKLIWGPRRDRSVGGATCCTWKRRNSSSTS